MDLDQCAVITIVGVILIIAFRVYSANQKAKRIREAGAVYNDSLRKLKASPSDANLREKALASGRAYVQAAREGGQRTIFDEMMLMNDLNAVAGGTVTLPETKTAQKAKAEAVKSVADRLNELQALKDSGLITEDEFNAKRAAILDKM
jgi:hypothetical protein